MEPPKDLMLQLKRKYTLEDFIETGTYRGGTALWAAAHFARVTTIEFSRALYEDMRAQHSGIHNINCIFGDSREALKTILPKLDRPAMLWLDSHWSGRRRISCSSMMPGCLPLPRRDRIA